MNVRKLIKEASFRMSRSSGAGGQHVNKVATRVELLFDVAVSEALSTNEKELVFKNLSHRISKKGIIQIGCQMSRSQSLNKREATIRFIRLIQKALKPVKKRGGIGKPISDSTKRLKNKRFQSEKKERRKKILPEG